MFCKKYQKNIVWVLRGFCAEERAEKVWHQHVNKHLYSYSCTIYSHFINLGIRARNFEAGNDKKKTTFPELKWLMVHEDGFKDGFKDGFEECLIALVQFYFGKMELWRDDEWMMKIAVLVVI